MICGCDLIDSCSRHITSQDFRRHISGVRWPAMKMAPDNYHRQRPDASSAHRRPSYPLSGCVPAEPDSVSLGNHTLAARNRDRKNASAPELCLKNPNRFKGTSTSRQKLSEKSKFTHSLGRRAVIVSQPPSPSFFRRILQTALTIRCNHGSSTAIRMGPLPPCSASGTQHRVFPYHFEPVYALLWQADSQEACRYLRSGVLYAFGTLVYRHSRRCA